MVQTIGRYAVSFVSAGAVVFTLFYMMQFLIATADRTLDEESAGRIMEFVRVPEPEVIRPKEPPKSHHHLMNRHRNHRHPSWIISIPQRRVLQWHPWMLIPP